MNTQNVSVDLERPFSAILVGSTGGIGSAFRDILSSQPDVGPELDGNPERLYCINRRHDENCSRSAINLCADLLSDHSLSAVSKTIQADIKEAGNPPVRLIVVATGALHCKDGSGPEKTIRSLSAQNMVELFKANTVVPSVIAKHFLPLLPKNGRSVFAVLSARVGSISDNQLGGWYSYRASKAALNQIVKTASIELKRTKPEAICVALHPGTVDTQLSKPYHSNVSDGKLFTPVHAATHLLNVLNQVEQSQSGQVLAWDGQEIPA